MKVASVRLEANRTMQPQLQPQLQPQNFIIGVHNVRPMFDPRRVFTVFGRRTAAVLTIPSVGGKSIANETKRNETKRNYLRVGKFQRRLIVSRFVSLGASASDSR